MFLARHEANKLFITVLLLSTVTPEVSNKKTDKRNSDSHRGTRIIEGEAANYADYPFMVSLLYYGAHICGGSLISERVVLTAAHCCFDSQDELFKTNELAAAVGSAKWKSATQFNVSKLIPHQKFDPDKAINDIALWVLTNQIQEKHGADVVKLYSNPVNEKEKEVQATVLGWGLTSKDGWLVLGVSEDLYKVNIHSVHLSKCKKHYDDIWAGHLCFSSADRRGSCNGDSGGPLVMKEASTLYQIGLVSYGADCNNTLPEVYTRISTYYSWITDNVVKTRKNRKDTRIIEGVLAKHSDYPFMVSLLYYGAHMCGGSLISDRVVLTAAHCCFDPRDGLFKTSELAVAVGSAKLKSAAKFKVRKLIPHQKYDPDTIVNDIALWILENQIQDKHRAGVVKLYSKPLNENEKEVQATVLGWGLTSKNGWLVRKAPDDLYKVNIHSVHLSKCEEYYDDIWDGHICFSSPDRRGSCNGDSGGPLVTKVKSKLYQIGLVSYGANCNNTKPEVYTRISTYYSWINDNLDKTRKKMNKKHKQ